VVPASECSWVDGREPFDHAFSYAAAVDCVFCGIIVGTRPAYRVVEHTDVVGFLDVRPVFKGHVLLAPREHHETLADLPASLLRPLFEQVQRASDAVISALEAHGSFVAINNTVSQSVPHLHVHVVPRRRKDGLRGFFWPRTRYVDDAEAESYADRLRAALGGTENGA
jgi:histidine triad (HIT) family protein